MIGGLPTRNARAIGPLRYWAGDVLDCLSIGLYFLILVGVMATHRHTQIGYVTAGTMAGIALLAAYTHRDRRGWVHTFIAGGHAVGALLFSSLTVVVEAGTLRFHFGPEFWERRTSLDDVQRVSALLYSTAGASTARPTAGSTTYRGSTR